MLDNQPLMHLTYLLVIMMAGLLSSILANRLRMPMMLFLVISGIGIGFLQNLLGWTSLSFGNSFIYSLSVFLLVLIVFDATSRFNINDVDKTSSKALKLAIAVTLINLFILSIASYYLFGLPSLWTAILFAGLIGGTAVDVVLPMLQDRVHEALTTLKLESIINTPLTVIIPFFVIDIVTVSKDSSQIVGDFVVSFLQTIVTGIGAGVVIGLIIFKVMRRSYSDMISPIALVVAALSSYILAETLRGNGVLAVTAMGLVFAFIYVKGKSHMQEFSSVFTLFLEMIVFVLVGTLIDVRRSFDFYLLTLIGFAVILLLRGIAVQAVLTKEMNWGEKLFITLNGPKGLATAVVILSLQVIAPPLGGLQVILDASLLIILYSIIVATVVTKFQTSFLGRIKKAPLAKA